MKTEDLDRKIGMPDVDAEWAKFSREVIGQETASRQGVVWWSMAIAASIALVAGIFIFGSETVEPESQIAQQTVKQTPPQLTSAPVVEEPQEDVVQIKAPSKLQPAKKRRKVVTKRVELIPTEEQDPFVAMAAQVEDIRSRGQRLHQEIEQRMRN